MKHASHYILPGARRIVLEGSYSDALCFVNKDNRIVLLVANQTADPKAVTFQLADGRSVCPTLPANSLNTFVFEGQ